MAQLLSKLLWHSYANTWCQRITIRWSVNNQLLKNADWFLKKFEFHNPNYYYYYYYIMNPQEIYLKLTGLAQHHMTLTVLQVEYEVENTAHIRNPTSKYSIWLCLVPFSRYLTLNNIMTLKSWLEVTYSASLCTICISLKSMDPGLSLRRWQFAFIFIQFYTASSKMKACMPLPISLAL